MKREDKEIKLKIKDLINIQDTWSCETCKFYYEDEGCFTKGCNLGRTLFWEELLDGERELPKKKNGSDNLLNIE